MEVRVLGRAGVEPIVLVLPVLAADRFTEDRAGAVAGRGCEILNELVLAASLEEVLGCARGRMEAVVLCRLRDDGAVVGDSERSCDFEREVLNGKSTLGDVEVAVAAIDELIETSGLSSSNSKLWVIQGVGSEHRGGGTREVERVVREIRELKRLWTGTCTASHDPRRTRELAAAGGEATLVAVASASSAA